MLLITHIEDIPYIYLPHKRLIQRCGHRKKVRYWLLYTLSLKLLILAKAHLHCFH